MYSKKAALFLSALSINFVYAANISFANSSGQEKVEALKVPANMVAVVHFQAINGKSLSKAELQERLLKTIIADKADEVKALTAMGADIEYEYTTFSKDGFKATPLNIANRLGRIRIVKALLELWVVVPDDFQFSCHNKDSYKILLEIVEEFSSLKDNALNSIYNGIFTFCDYQNSGEVVVDQVGFSEYLKKCQSVGITVNELWNKICNSCLQYEMMEEFLKQGANPNLVVQDGQDYTRTPLSNAIGEAQRKCVKLLLDYGANVHLCINCGKNVSFSPLQLAFQQGNAEVIELLLDHGATF